MKCCVVGCESRYSAHLSITFHRFPKINQRFSVEYQKLQKLRLKKWINVVHQKNVSIDNVHRLKICSRHFLKGFPSDFRETLDPDWAPSVNLNYSKLSSNDLQQRILRYDRYINRERRIKRECVERELEELRRIKEEPRYNEDKPVPVTSKQCNQHQCDYDRGHRDGVGSFINLQSVSEFQDTGSTTNDMALEPPDAVEVSGNDKQYDSAEPDTGYTTNDIALEEPPDAVEVSGNDEQYDSMDQGTGSTTNDIALKEPPDAVEVNSNDEQYDSAERIKLLLQELNLRLQEIHTLRSEVADCNFTEDAFKGNEKKFTFYCGVKRDVFNVILQFIEQEVSKVKCKRLSSFQKLFLTLMKLRHDTTFQELAYRFKIMQREAADVFRQVIVILEHAYSGLIHWPDRESLRALAPFCFRECFGNAVCVIIDCFEITMERPSILKSKAQTFSNYKQRNTVKYLIGITPHGFVSFISEGWGGRVSDKIITNNCGILDNLLCGDIVLADRGFTISEMVTTYQAKLNIPDFTRKVSQLQPRARHRTQNIASVRIHVERVIGNIRQKFKILRGPIPLTLLRWKSSDKSLLDCIVRVCCILENLSDSVVPL